MEVSMSEHESINKITKMLLFSIKRKMLLYGQLRKELILLILWRLKEPVTDYQLIANAFCKLT